MLLLSILFIVIIYCGYKFATWKKSDVEPILHEADLITYKESESKKHVASKGFDVSILVNDYLAKTPEFAKEFRELNINVNSDDFWKLSPEQQKVRDRIDKKDETVRNIKNSVHSAFYSLTGVLSDDTLYQTEKSINALLEKIAICAQFTHYKGYDNAVAQSYKELTDEARATMTPEYLSLIQNPDVQRAKPLLLPILKAEIVKDIENRNIGFSEYKRKSARSASILKYREKINELITKYGFKESDFPEIAPESEIHLKI